jgi:hypothetical protein
VDWVWVGGDESGCQERQSEEEEEEKREAVERRYLEKPWKERVGPQSWHTGM